MERYVIEKKEPPKNSIFEIILKIVARLFFPIVFVSFLFMYLFGGLLFGKKGIELADDLFFNGYLLFIE